jgi:hypothetical protein
VLELPQSKFKPLCRYPDVNLPAFTVSFCHNDYNNDSGCAGLGHLGQNSTNYLCRISQSGQTTVLALAFLSFSTGCFVANFANANKPLHINILKANVRIKEYLRLLSPG